MQRTRCFMGPVTDAGFSKKSARWKVKEPLRWGRIHSGQLTPSDLESRSRPCSTKIEARQY
eukprot:scaffold254167_cov31-Prasinocladus_malaysianus.AAC.1